MDIHTTHTNYYETQFSYLYAMCFSLLNLFAHDLCFMIERNLLRRHFITGYVCLCYFQAIEFQLYCGFIDETIDGW